MIQARYGWKDEYIRALPFARYQEIVSVAGDRASEQQAVTVAQTLSLAHIAWILSAVYGGSKREFGDYLKALGLDTEAGSRMKQQKEKMTRQEQAEQAYEKADNIVSLLSHRERRGGE